LRAHVAMGRGQAEGLRAHVAMGRGQAEAGRAHSAMLRGQAEAGVLKRGHACTVHFPLFSRTKAQAPV